MNELKILGEQLILQKIKVQKETEKLEKLKDQIIELSKNHESSYKINSNLGVIKVLKNKNNIFYSIQSKEFNQIDINLRRQLIKDNFILMSFRINQDKFRNNKDSKVVGILEKLVKEKIRKPFNILISIDKNIYLVGDSHAGRLFNSLQNNIASNQYNLKIFGTPFFENHKLMNIRTNKEKVPESNNQLIVNEELSKIIKNSNNEIFIFHARYPLYFSGGLYYNNTEGGQEEYGDGIYTDFYLSFKNAEAV